MLISLTNMEKDARNNKIIKNDGVSALTEKTKDVEKNIHYSLMAWKKTVMKIPISLY